MVTEKTNKLTFCIGISVVVISFLFQSELTWVGGLSSVAICALMTYWVVQHSNEETPAAGFMPLYIFVIILTSCLQRWDALVEAYGRSAETLYREPLELLFDSPIGLAVFVFGAFVTITGLMVRKLRPLGVGCMALGLVFATWTRSVGTFYFLPYGREGLVAFSVFLFAILGADAISKATDTQSQSLCDVLSVVNICGLLAVFLLCENYAITQAYAFCMSLPDIHAELFAWWRLILISAGLIVSCITMASEEVEEYDSLVVEMILLLYLAGHLFTAFYFTYNWALFLALFATCIGCIKLNETWKGENTYGARVMMPIAFALIVAIQVCIVNGLFPNLIVTVLLAVLFFAKFDWFFEDGKPFRTYSSVATFLFLEVFAWRLARGFSLESIAFLIAVYAMAVVCLKVLYLSDANDIDRSMVYSRIIVGCLCVAFLPFLRSPITVEGGERNVNGSVSLNIKGNESEIVSSEYSWRDYLGREVEGGEFYRQTLGSLNEIKGDVLIVTVKDANGTQCVRFYYYPTWMQGFESSEPAGY